MVLFCAQLRSGLLAGGCLMFGSVPVHAEAAGSGHPLYAAGELGFASTTLEVPGDSRRQNATSMAFEGGIAFTPAVSAGLRLGGWTLHAADFNRPGEGESLSLVAVALRYQPVARPRLLIRGSVGGVSYNNDTPAGFDGSGNAVSLGIGYDYPLTPSLHITPVLDISRGTFSLDDNIFAPPGSTRFQVISLGLEVRFQSTPGD